ncbi:hypothetical protein HDU67_000308 [Dinochytrium kinnereticum]|nr:hypothetical protein HDU67_000308 [Dinochytrium kinnereticum]
MALPPMGPEPLAPPTPSDGKMKTDASSVVLWDVVKVIALLHFLVFAYCRESALSFKLTRTDIRKWKDLRKVLS